MTPKMRWVAPPNWPDVPKGFEPPDGWQPDPSWPPPPEGWQFWQREGVDVHSGLSRWQRSRRTWVGTAVTVAFLAVLLILLIGVPWHHSRGHFDPAALDQQIEQKYSKRGVPGTVVDCPSGEQLKAGSQFLCTLKGAAPYHFVKIDVLNSAGQFTFEAVP